MQLICASLCAFLNTLEQYGFPGVFERGLCCLIQALVSSVMGCIKVVFGEVDGVGQKQAVVWHILANSFLCCNTYSIQIGTKKPEYVVWFVLRWRVSDV